MEASFLAKPNIKNAFCKNWLADHAQGNLRSLMIMADELLAAAAERQAERIDEALLFEACALAPQPKAVAGRRR